MKYNGRIYISFFTMRQDLSSSGKVDRGSFLERALLGAPKLAPVDWDLDKIGGLNQVRKWVDHNLAGVMAKIRAHQEGDPSLPSRPFLKELSMDIDSALEELTDMEGKELRVYSAVETPLDLNGVDFWFELVEEETGRVLADYKVDLTANLNKTQPAGLADMVYYYDTSLDDEGGFKAVRNGADYEYLVEAVTDNLVRRAHLPRKH